MHEAILDDERAKLLKPGTGRLFEPINSLVKLANTVRTLGIHKTRRLSHEYCLLKKTMQEGILNIQLSQRPTKTDSQTENSTYSGTLNHGAKCLIIIKAMLL